MDSKDPDVGVGAKPPLLAARGTLHLEATGAPQPLYSKGAGVLACPSRLSLALILCWPQWGQKPPESSCPLPMTQTAQYFH